jgi:protein-disulfide isomerase
MDKVTKFLKNPLFITFIILVIGIGGLIALVKLVPEKQTADVPMVEHFWGKADAKVVVTEYSDLQCPACLSFFETTEKPLKQNYEGQIKFVYKHFPLRRPHPNAQRAAEASEAASAQGKFWEYHDLLFSRQTAEATTWNTDKLTSYAKELGLDTEKFKKELQDRTYKNLVNKYEKEALDKNYTGTPTIEVNGKRIENPTYENIEEEIKKILGETTVTPTVVPTVTPTVQ